MNYLVRSGILRRLLLSIVVVSLVPLVVLGAYTLRTTRDVGDTAIESSREALDTKTAEALELRAVDTANYVASFLEERERDIRSTALLPRTAPAFLPFYRARQGDLWMRQAKREVRVTVPLYREAAFIDASGHEKLKIVDGRIASPEEMRDVADPANTTYRSETYFLDARGLAPGQVYVSHVTGSYVDRAGFDAGIRFQGVLRLAAPTFDADGRLDGVVALALDSRHLQEFTAHIVPTGQRFAVASDPNSGNYAYIIDDRSHVIAHPTDYLIVGLGPGGKEIPDASNQEEIGRRPVRLDRLGFVDENLASIPARAARGESGSIQYYWAGLDKFVAFAPIPYYGGAYEPPAGFGWVAIGADVATFHEAATSLGAIIEQRVRTLTATALLILIGTALAVLATAGVLAHQISRPIQRLTAAARAVEEGDSEAVTHIHSVTSRTDELGQLARVFKSMAAEVYLREQQLRQQVSELQIEIDSAKRQREVDEIVESDRFKQLKARAQQLRGSGGKPPAKG